MMDKKIKKMLQRKKYNIEGRRNDWLHNKVDEWRKVKKFAPLFKILDVINFQISKEVGR
jgi:hypothetical protein